MILIRLLVIFLLLFCGPSLVMAQEATSLISWNIQDLGRSKSDAEIELMADLLKDYDIIAIQEVVAGYGGSQAVARLADELNRKGSKWDYTISNPTASPKYKAEKYAYIWKTSKVRKVGRAHLVSQLKDCVYREPYQITFSSPDQTFTILNYHSRTHDEQPQVEVACMSDYLKLLTTDRVIIAGDFNIEASDPVFSLFKNQGCIPSLMDDKTTLKRTCKEGVYLYHAIDNIFYTHKTIALTDRGTVDFVAGCERLTAMRMISDHLPVYIFFKAIKEAPKRG